jgi:predicted P-loop ATPase/GTPase
MIFQGSFAQMTHALLGSAHDAWNIKVSKMFSTLRPVKIIRLKARILGEKQPFFLPKCQFFKSGRPFV